MKYHSQYLKKYISVNETPETIAQNLILKTCEIEEIETRTIDPNIVIGKILSCEKHPDADKLTICQVDCGTKGQFQIICGGENVAPGIYVPTALSGAFFKESGITIAKRNMRGVESNGMICAKEELGIKEDMDHHWIWSLQEDFDDISDADLGTALGDKYPRLNSFVFDVDNKCLTNRPDLTGHFGAAPELYTIFSNFSFTKIADWYKTFDTTNILDTLAHATPARRKVISKTNGLRSYTLIEIDAVTIAQTSFFSRLAMLDMGGNPKNNWVDFSNNFMLLTSQPIHFFDADKVNGDIIVRNAEAGEQFTDLFETTHSLLPTDIVIADSSKILALAGVVGGLESGVTENTKNILVEIANFDPVIVRKTGTRLSLRTDAELRYEKNINPRWTLYCLLVFLDELTYFAKDLGTYTLGGIASFVSDTIHAEKTKTILVNTQEMSSRIFGSQLENITEIAQNILVKLGFHVSLLENNTLSVVPPIWRSPDDFTIPEDIYEEVARIYGYDAIPFLKLPSSVSHVPFTQTVRLQRQLEEILAQELRADQTETYPWIGEKEITLFGSTPDKHYKILNPVNPESPFLRDNLLYGLIEHASKNSKFFDQFTLFDLGKVRNKSEAKTGSDSTFATDIIHEEFQLGVVVYQKNVSDRSQDPFLHAKNIIKHIFDSLGIQQTPLFTPTSIASFHPNKQASFQAGSIGTIHPLTLKSRKFPETGSVVGITIDLPSLADILTQQGDAKPSYESLQDQILLRDLCFVVDNETPFTALLEAIKSLPEINAIEVFDLYKGDRLPAGKKSLSLQIKIKGDGNLTTDAINTIMDKAIKAAESTGAQLRA